MQRGPFTRFQTNTPQPSVPKETTSAGARKRRLIFREGQSLLPPNGEESRSGDDESGSPTESASGEETSLIRSNVDSECEEEREEASTLTYCEVAGIFHTLASFAISAKRVCVNLLFGKASAEQDVHSQSDRPTDT